MVVSWAPAPNVFSKAPVLLRFSLTSQWQAWLKLSISEAVAVSVFTLEGRYHMTLDNRKTPLVSSMSFEVIGRG